MKVVFSDEAWEDYLYWQEQDRRMLRRINGLINETKRDPFKGTGKPEPLKSSLQNPLI
jgi:toxin YoeB